jgi:hypothetical protein
MNSTIDVLEKYGLVTEERARDFAATLTHATWNLVCHELRDSLVCDLDIFEPIVDLNPFNFLASASLRGDAGCAGLRCRMRKVNMIGRYAGLFCDKVILPIHLHGYDQDVPLEVVKRSFLGSVMTLIELRPLIEAGIIKPVGELDFCPLCHPERIPLSQPIIDAAEALKRNNFSEFSIEKVHAGGGQDGLLFRGPADYLEHGLVFKTRTPFPLDDLPYGVLSTDLLKKSRYVDALFYQIVRDVVLQQIYGMRFNAKYLTDLAGEANVLAVLNEDDQMAARTAALCAQMSHRVPLLGEVPLEHIVKIRKEDHTAFLNYRIALQKIISQYVGDKAELTDNAARELFSDELEPKIREMEVLAATERRTTLAKSGAKVAATFAGVYMGVHAGIIPSEMATIVNALGGVKILADLAEAIATLNNSTVRNHNLFFLLRLKQESDA